VNTGASARESTTTPGRFTKPPYRAIVAVLALAVLGGLVVTLIPPTAPRPALVHVPEITGGSSRNADHGIG